VLLLATSSATDPAAAALLAEARARAEAQRRASSSSAAHGTTHRSPRRLRASTPEAEYAEARRRVLASLPPGMVLDRSRLDHTLARRLLRRDAGRDWIARVLRAGDRAAAMSAADADAYVARTIAAAEREVAQEGSDHGGGDPGRGEEEGCERRRGSEGREKAGKARSRVPSGGAAVLHPVRPALDGASRQDMADCHPGERGGAVLPGNLRGGPPTAGAECRAPRPRRSAGAGLVQRPSGDRRVRHALTGARSLRDLVLIALVNLILTHRGTSRASRTSGRRSFANDGARAAVTAPAEVATAPPAPLSGKCSAEARTG
jgi:hypothetical protein